MTPSDSATAIAADVRAGRRRAVDVCRSALSAIEATAELGAFLETMPESALAAAAAVDAAVAARRQVGPLAGVPIAVKDNICTANGRTTCASRILADYRSPFSATEIGRAHV